MGCELSDGAKRSPRLTHEEIADRIGTARETVSRLLSDFKRKGLIQQRGAMLVIRNRAALDALIAAPSPQRSTEGATPAVSTITQSEMYSRRSAT